MSDLFIQNFRGIRKINPVCDVVASGVISAVNCQNVELKNTQDSNNVAIFTSKGNKCVKDIGKTIIGQFESVQAGVSYWFIYAVDDKQGYLYNYDSIKNEVVLVKDGLSVNNVANGITIAQGYDDWFVFTNGIDDYLAVCMAKELESERVQFLNAVDAEQRQIRGLGLEVQEARLVTFCKNRVHWSAQGNIFDWVSANPEIVTGPAYQEFDRDVTAIVFYNNMLVAFTDEYSVAFSGNPSDALNFKRSGASGGGCASFRSVIRFDNKLFYYDNKAKNVFAYYLLDSGQTRPTNGFADNVIETIGKIDSTRLNEIELVSYISGNKSEIWLKFPTINNNAVLIYDYINSEWIERCAQADIRAFALVKGGLYSAYNTKLLKEYVGTDFDGMYIPSEYKMSIINLNSDSNIKVPKMPLVLTLDFDKENDFFMEFIYDDLYEKAKQKHIVKLLKGYLVWSKDNADENGGCWALDQEDKNGGIWVNNKKSSVTFNLDGVYSFKRLQIRIFTKEYPQEFGVKRIEFKRVRLKTKSLG